MLFLCNSRMAPGVKREQVIEYLTSTRMSDVGWDLVRREIISHVLWKVGERPGVAFTVNADGEQAIRRVLDELEPVKSGLIEFDIDPVSPFRQFD